MISTEVLVDGSRMLFVKRADPALADDVARLRREATMLELARHPGVVEVATPPRGSAPGRAETAPAPIELRTIYAGARTLASAELTPDLALTALSAAAETLADLHGLGLVHGRVDADHVVITGSARAVVCGFGEAGLAGDQRPDGQILLPSLDVASLGALLSSLLDRLEDPAPPPPARRRIADVAALRCLVDRATVADTRLRPSARAFASALDAARPRPAAAAARPPGPGAVARPLEAVATPPGPDAPSASRRADAATSSADRSITRARRSNLVSTGARRRGSWVLAAVGATTAITAIGFGLSTLTEPTHRSATAASSASSAVPDEHEADEADGNDLEGGSRAQPGGVIDLAGRRYSIGTSDDQVLHAVWSCAGPDAAVLVRPDGSVYRFESMAETGHDVQGLPAGHLPAGAAAQLVRDANGCVELQAGDVLDAVTLVIASASTPATPS